MTVEQGHTATGKAASTRVWDPGVRLFHWGLLAAFVTAYATGGEIRWLHEDAGYVAAALIAFRLVWGFIGSRHARFADFVRAPKAVLAYLQAIRKGHPGRYLGHNPAGGAMVLALLLAVSLIALSGWLMTTDRFWGVQWVENVHELLVNGTLFLVCLHLTGVFIASRQHHENLVLSMLTGRKRMD
jgi:cytochrome b